MSLDASLDELHGVARGFVRCMDRIAESSERIAEAQEQQAASLRLLAVNDTEKLARGLAATKQLGETHKLLMESLRPPVLLTEGGRPSEPVEMD